MIYIKTELEYPSPRLPPLTYTETDDELWEIRKVEIFRDGRMAYADKDTEMGDTGLSDLPELPVEQKIANFVRVVISKTEFEVLWAAARRAVAAERR